MDKTNNLHTISIIFSVAVWCTIGTDKIDSAAVAKDLGHACRPSIAKQTDTNKTARLLCRIQFGQGLTHYSNA
ncbi:MAG: hypothetical protein C0624_13075 [Desulfuromonas sp.]|nr:MAG: hypothetical protein C0624_13075 [Desulfuromonas sp.]